ncbi:hypothetical protein Bcep18194_C7353 [Burkholderia lata]|uniref:Uncharacterized protein n=1 Tax=Burkholderia lata (strain ATCC 17760 / DSM 23089 / LMG 22485 / NCIMB 9086 / R18194 / 383) TaxID=482957 RepID=Q39MB9_BURL3|nr:hypothetical protein Bcep18194_C7353 [Burkholderia lata]
MNALCAIPASPRIACHVSACIEVKRMSAIEMVEPGYSVHRMTRGEVHLVLATGAGCRPFEKSLVNTALERCATVDVQRPFAQYAPTSGRPDLGTRE